MDMKEYLSGAAGSFLRQAARSARKNPGQAAFIVKYAAGQPGAVKKRQALREKGIPLPPFMTMEIGEAFPEGLSLQEYGRIFQEASAIGITCVCLLCSDLRPDILNLASKRQDVLFPVLLDGTEPKAIPLELFAEHPNLVPILTLSAAQISDKAAYSGFLALLGRLRARNLLFGAAPSISSGHWEKALAPTFLQLLDRTGCILLLYMEAIAPESGGPLSPEERRFFAAGKARITSHYKSMVILSFPSDEAHSGGCIGAGRGVFHITSSGEVTPCPFLSCWDRRIQGSSLPSALASPLFKELASSGWMEELPQDRCALYPRLEKMDDLTRKGQNS